MIYISYMQLLSNITSTDMITTLFCGILDAAVVGEEREDVK
jgi:hypothetical protein